MAWYSPCNPIEISVTMSAILICTSWFRASGLLNCLLSNVYCRATSKHASAAPSAPHAIPYRALFKHLSFGGGGSGGGVSIYSTNAGNADALSTIS